jgi:hypothetical protein
MSIAQVDLGTPPHRRDLVSQPRIFSDVMEVVLRRLGERSQSGLLTMFSSGVKTVQKVGGVYTLDVEPSPSPQREIPPLIYTPGYRRKSF